MTMISTSSAHTLYAVRTVSPPCDKRYASPSPTRSVSVVTPCASQAAPAALLVHADGRLRLAATGGSHARRVV
jgi:hypothetical protein